MKDLDFNRLKLLVSGFDKLRVLVIGDLILDEYIWGKVTRISPEAPIPVVWVNSENFVPGGACNVANNIRALGSRAEVAGAIGRDNNGKRLLQLLRKRGVGTDGIFRDASRTTTLKTRIIAHHQQVVRIDREHVVPVPEKLRDRVMKRLKKRIAAVDAICLEDYGKGVVTPELVHEVVRLAKSRGKVITVDPKEDHLSYYKGVTCITPNNHEASTLSGITIRDDESLRKAGQKLLKILACENVLITLGENGMCLFQKGLKPVKIRTLAQDVFDVSGAGDTVIGTYTLALAQGATPLEAAHLANCAAGIVVEKVGTATVSRSELLKRVKRILQEGNDSGPLNGTLQSAVGSASGGKP